MSWNVSVPSTPGAELNAALDALTVPDYIAEAVRPATADQLTQAVAAVKAIIGSGALGNPRQYSFTASLGGHANPRHAPLDGWANDAINISLSQFPLPTPAEPEPVAASASAETEGEGSAS